MWGTPDARQSCSGALWVRLVCDHMGATPGASQQGRVLRGVKICELEDLKGCLQVDDAHRLARPEGLGMGTSFCSRSPCAFRVRDGLHSVAVPSAGHAGQAQTAP